MPRPWRAFIKIWCCPNRKLKIHKFSNGTLFLVFFSLYIYVTTWFVKLQTVTQNSVLILCTYKPKLFKAKPNPLKCITWHICSDIPARLQTIGQEYSFLRPFHCSTMDRQSWMQDTLFYSLEPDDVEGNLLSKARIFADENILPLSVLAWFTSHFFRYTQE